MSDVNKLILARILLHNLCYKTIFLQMSGNTEVLFIPLKIGDITIKNRITMGAMTRSRAENTYPTELMKEYYVQRAGAGLIITEGILITRQG